MKHYFPENDYDFDEIKQDESFVTPATNTEFIHKKNNYFYTAFLILFFTLFLFICGESVAELINDSFLLANWYGWTVSALIIFIVSIIFTTKRV